MSLLNAMWGRDDEEAETIPPPPDRFVCVAICRCGVRVDEEGWREFDYVGAWPDASGIMSVRVCGFCGSNIKRPYDAERAP